ncbi:MAG: hypothetical protein RMY28_027350 [Nostoc sp. ChiSLP01]|nr:hypothetical protein [Nostoc sp. CmiSLP01]MDZ8282374.1 hypothetical protein [Nostoc sp. ChiSLP01]
MSKQISTLDLLVELTTEEQQLLSGGQDGGPADPPPTDVQDPLTDETDQQNPINILSLATPIPR